MRVYNENVNISMKNMQSFWNGRSQKYDENAPFVSVKLGDNVPERAVKWDEYEKKNIIHLLNIKETDNVLELGCGIGRLSDVIIPNCNFYFGTDYAEELIKIANKRNNYPTNNYSFATASMTDISREYLRKNYPKADTDYNLIIIDGVLPYVNDKEVEDSFRQLLLLTADKCLIYIGTAIAISQRLTLNDYFSDELQCNYSAIYRTDDEQMELFKVFLDNGFSLDKKIDCDIATTNNAETKRIFYILKK